MEENSNKDKDILVNGEFHINKTVISRHNVPATCMLTIYIQFVNKP